MSDGGLCQWVTLTCCNIKKRTEAHSKKDKHCPQMQEWEYVPARMGAATIPPVNHHTIMEYVAMIAQCMYKVLRIKI